MQGSDDNIKKELCRTVPRTFLISEVGTIETLVNFTGNVNMWIYTDFDELTVSLVFEWSPPSSDSYSRSSSSSTSSTPEENQ